MWTHRLCAVKSQLLTSSSHSRLAQIANCESIAPYFDDVDAPLIAKLKDIRVHRDVEDPRGAKVEFVFHDNDFLADNTLVKEFVVKPDANPLGSEDFDWSEDLEAKPCTIQWKSDEVNLCKKKPTAAVEDDDDDAFEPGSFFSSFFESTSPQIANGIGQAIVNTFYPSVIEWYTGEAIGAFGDFDDDMFDSEEDEEDDDAEEIDLEEEEKKTKKPKTDQ